MGAVFGDRGDQPPLHQTHSRRTASMKLGTLKDGTRDGVLVVVSRDLTHAVPADHIAPTLQDALDDWDYCAPQLATLYEDLIRAPSPRPFAPHFSQFAT